jgi:TetR/AcrR family transcriptional regulator
MTAKTNALAADEPVKRAKAATGRGGRAAVRLESDAAKIANLPPIELPKVPRKARVSQRRGDDVRERILQAALECFGAFGFEGTSTRAVAERANVTHTLILYHFGSKDELWIATMDNALGAYVNSVGTNLENQEDRDAADVLKRFIEQFVRLSAKFPQIHRIMTMEGNQNTTRLQWIIDNYLREHFTRVRDVIKRGQAEGSVRECDATRLYYYIIGAGGTLFTLSTEYRALTGRDVFSEAEIFRNIAFLYETVFI